MISLSAAASAGGKSSDTDKRSSKMVLFTSVPSRPAATFACMLPLYPTFGRGTGFFTPLALKTAKGQHLPALVVYKNQSPNIATQLTGGFGGIKMTGVSNMSLYILQFPHGSLH